MIYNIDIFNKYLEIKQDLVNNLRDVFNRQHYYTHKYRGNVITDINVGLMYDTDGNKIIQIFIRNNGKWIKDKLTFNFKGLYRSEIKTNMYEDYEGESIDDSK